MAQGMGEEERELVVGGDSPRLFWEMVGGGALVSEALEAPAPGVLLREGSVSNILMSTVWNREPRARWPRAELGLE